MCVSAERALEAQKRMGPYIKEAEEDAKTMSDALEIQPTRIHEMIPTKSFKKESKGTFSGSQNSTSKDSHKI